MPSKLIAAVAAFAVGSSAYSAYSAAVAAQQQPASPVETVLNGLAFRNIGPFRTAAWVTAIAVPETPARDHLYTVYAATRSGGLWKTTNAGTTWKPISDSVGAAAVGAVAIAPSNPSVVWMGTGDQANARSSYSGKGVFKSTDAGATWEFMGLPHSHHIARILIHPTKPDVVYVAAIGHLFSKNEERGVFRTTDGGKTWSKILYKNTTTGCSDIAMDPSDAKTLYAGMYTHLRRPWRFDSGGGETALYKTTDGGDTWKKLTNGLPTEPMDRPGMAVSLSNPNIVYLITETKTQGTFFLGFNTILNWNDLDAGQAAPGARGTASQIPQERE